jgi:hypothetical protein
MLVDRFETLPAFSELRRGLCAGTYDVERTLSGTRVKKKVGSDPRVSIVRIARPTISRLSQQCLVNEPKDVSLG